MVSRMPLSFPNQSRSYDTRQHCVRFWAYDQALEIPFFVDADALCCIDPNVTRDESGLLGAFDLLAGVEGLGLAPARLARTQVDHHEHDQQHQPDEHQKVGQIPAHSGCPRSPPSSARNYAGLHTDASGS